MICHHFRWINLAHSNRLSCNYSQGGSEWLMKTLPYRYVYCLSNWLLIKNQDPLRGPRTSDEYFDTNFWLTTTRDIDIDDRSGFRLLFIRIIQRISSTSDRSPSRLELSANCSILRRILPPRSTRTMPRTLQISCIFRHRLNIYLSMVW